MILINHCGILTVINDTDKSAGLDDSAKIATDRNSGVGNQADTKSPHRYKRAAGLYGCRT